MRHKNEFDLLTPEQINEEIALRADMLKQLVGWLYTGIMEDEIYMLRERKNYLRDHINVEAFDNIKKPD